MLQQPTNSFTGKKRVKIKPIDSKYITIKIVSSLDKSPMTGWLFLWITSDATGTCKNHMNKEQNLQNLVIYWNWSVGTAEIMKGKTGH